ncbi:HU family DNA-binding protein [Dysgonomonas termitidis]|uniref:HU family DNA-binding protein n=1 Tax=Dysgonomonas termitidis TaxID=1516126 RepID=A0ABV9KZD5_9BACT
MAKKKSEIDKLVSLAAKKAGVSQKYIADSLSPVLETIIEVLSGGNNITIQGFGSFQVKTMKERKSRNPKTGELIVLPERMVVKFKLTNGNPVK